MPPTCALSIPQLSWQYWIRVTSAHGERFRGGDPQISAAFRCGGWNRALGGCVDQEAHGRLLLGKDVWFVAGGKNFQRKSRTDSYRLELSPTAKQHTGLEQRSSSETPVTWLLVGVRRPLGPSRRTGRLFALHFQKKVGSVPSPVSFFSTSLKPFRISSLRPFSTLFLGISPKKGKGLRGAANQTENSQKIKKMLLRTPSPSLSALSLPVAAAPHGRPARGPPESSLQVDARLVIAILKTDARC
jgi:hypothetical protein